MKHLPLLIFLCIAMAGCRTQYVPVETVRSEYKDRIRETYTVDSVTDTRLVYVKGDTVIDWRDRVKWRDREVHDTIYIEKADTICVQYPIERKLTRWEQTKLKLGGLTAVIASATAIIMLLFCCFTRIRKHINN